MNPKIKLALVAASAASAAATVIGQVPAALAGPTLDSTSTQTYSAQGAFNLNAAQTYEVTGSSSSIITPFASSVNALGATAAALGGVQLSNAGTSTLTAAFDRNGFGGTVSTESSLATPTFAVQAGVIPLGGLGATFGVTTALATTTASNTFQVPTSVVLNQGTGTNQGVPSIVLIGSSSSTGISGASTSSTSIGASAITGTFNDSFKVINSLSAF